MLPVSSLPKTEYPARQAGPVRRVAFPLAFQGSGLLDTGKVQTSQAFYPARPKPWAIKAFQQVFSFFICSPLGFKTEIENLDRLKQLQKQPNGLILAMNHSSLADTASVQRLAAQASMTPMIMASLSTFHHKILHMPMQLIWPVASRLGMFSVNEANPTMAASKAFAHQVLTDRKYPLCIFPEGRVNWNNAQVGPCRIGTMQFALKAANANKQAVNVVPIGIYYTYSPKAEKQAKSTLNRLESKVKSMLAQDNKLRPLKNLPENATMSQRIDRLMEAVIQQQERIYGLTNSALSMSGRLEKICDKMLETLRKDYGVTEVLDVDREAPRLYKVISEAQRRNQKPSFWIMLNPWSDKRKAYKTALKKIQADTQKLNNLEILKSCTNAGPCPSNLDSRIEALNRLRCLILGKRPGALSVIRNCTAHIRIGDPIAVAPMPQVSDATLHSQSLTLTNQLRAGLVKAVSGRPTSTTTA